MWKTTNGFGEEKVFFSEEESKYKNALITIYDLLTLALESEKADTHFTLVCNALNKAKEVLTK